MTCIIWIIVGLGAAFLAALFCYEIWCIFRI